jgi:hypothetical protein
VLTPIHTRIESKKAISSTMIRAQNKFWNTIQEGERNSFAAPIHKQENVAAASLTTIAVMTP